MKSVLFLIVFFPFILIGQAPQMSIQSQQDVESIKQNIPFILKDSDGYMEKLPLTLINDEIYVSFLGKLREVETDSYSDEDVIIGKGVGKVRSIRIRLGALDKIEELTYLEFLELASKIKPDLERARFDTRADSVHLGLGLPNSFTGKNVLIGVQDWGFDYTHPMFYDTLLETSRVIAAWDQWKRSGPHPTGFDYGTEYTTWAELSAVESDTANQYGYGTHATHVAGIAGGSGAGTANRGIAFESEFIFSTIFVDEAAAIDSWYWMYEKAQEYEKNLIVNMSWGLYNIGTYDGTSLGSEAIDELTDAGVLFVTSAGNNGGVNFHIQHDFDNDSIRSIVRFENYSQVDSLYGQSLHGWGEIGKDFAFKISAGTPTNYLGETPYFSASMNTYLEDFFVVNEDTVFYKVSAQHAHPQNNKPALRIQVKNKKASLPIILTVKADEGTVHCWNIADLTTNGGNWGMPFQAGSGEIAMVGGNKEFGIGEPAAASSCIAVAAHQADYRLLSGNISIGSRASFSSIGPRLDGAIKPDISAPGFNVLSSISSFTNNSYSPSGSVSFQGKTYYFSKFSGTSMASPAAAGVCALVWEVNPYLTPLQLKEIVMESARTDAKTGTIPEEGSERWGKGKIDAMNAIRLALGIVGTQEYTNESLPWEVYPNPASSTITLSGVENPQRIQLFDMSGRAIDLDETQTSWSVENIASGVYIFRMIVDNKVHQKKVVIQ